MTPERFGRYEIVERIASGGMAEILRARSASLGGVERDVVIKRILPQYSSDRRFVSMFIDEARITIGLEHKNVVRLYDFGQDEGRYYMAIEYVDGTDLSAVLRGLVAGTDVVDERLAAFVARELCLGLHHAHTLTDHKGTPLHIVHRDVSPQNVLLSLAGEVKLTDFGIAAAAHKLTLTQPGTVLGKAAYMSPEQATGKPVDFRTDIWAVGVILYELLTGERLFADDTAMSTVDRVLRQKITAPSAFRPSVSPEIDAIALGALQRDPSKRYPSALAMAEALSAFLRAFPIAGAPYGEQHLAAALRTLVAGDDARVRPALNALRAGGATIKSVPTQVTAPHPGKQSATPELLRLQEALRARPDVWTVVEMGEHLAAQGDSARAASAFRTAAAVFAHQGLLVQALCAYDGAKALLSADEVRTDLVRLGDLRSHDRKELVRLLTQIDRHGFWEQLSAADPKGLGDVQGAGRASRGPETPLLSRLGPLELARLGAAVRVRHCAPGDTILTEGDAGDALFAVGSGRVVVFCKPGDDASANAVAVPLTDGASFDDLMTSGRAQAIDSAHAFSQDASGSGAVSGSRVYLAGLADGDFFGEFSFLSERPRSASVEAVTPCRVLQIDRAVVSALIAEDPAFTEPLLQFYKERVVELLMAKSPLFSLLSPAERRALLDASVAVDYADSAVVVEEGTLHDALFFIRRGEAEVYRRAQDGSSIFINKLIPGQFFGEIAALRGTARSVSVRAMGPLQVFRIDRHHMLDAVNREPRLRAQLEATISSRTAEMRERVREHERLFFST